MGMVPVMIEIKQLHFAYDNQPVFTGIDLFIRAGQITGIVGPNGAGKSTLAKLLSGILQPSRGTIYIGGRNGAELSSRERARLVGYLPQEFSSPFHFRVEEVVQMGRYPFTSGVGALTEADIQAVESAMRSTDVWQFRHRSFNSLSGGEKQRVMLASVLAQETPIFVLDEPLRALDYAHQAQLIQLLQAENRQQQKTIIWITHDVNLAGRFCHTLIAMRRGKIVASGSPREVLQTATLQDIFGIPMDIHWMTPEIPVIYWQTPDSREGQG